MREGFYHGVSGMLFRAREVSKRKGGFGIGEMGSSDNMSEDQSTMLI